MLESRRKDNGSRHDAREMLKKNGSEHDAQEPPKR